MGNKLGRKVEEKYTRPHGLYHHKDVDHKKLRKLILDYKLAPCYPGEDECGFDLEECPICFLYYPSLNRSRCCTKGICTECFLKMKTPNSGLPTQCPFCKTFNYAVEYRGVKTKAEKGLEQIEEQRVIDAKIRIRWKEIKEEEERMRSRQDMSSTSSRLNEPNDVGFISETGEEIFSSQQLGGSAIQHPSGYRQNRDDEADLENIMVMEAIWLSIQEDSKRHHNYGDAAQLARYAAELRVSAAMAPHAESTSSSSSSGSLAYTLASLAEDQVGIESSTNSSNLSMYNGAYDDFSEVDDHASGTTGSYPRQDEMDMVEVPESFEEQMMVAMAVSLSEARAMTRSHEITWR